MRVVVGVLILGAYLFRSYWLPFCESDLYRTNFFFRYRYELTIYFLDNDVGTFVLYSNYGKHTVEKVLCCIFGADDYVAFTDPQGQVIYYKKDQVGKLQLSVKKIR